MGVGGAGQEVAGKNADRERGEQAFPGSQNKQKSTENGRRETNKMDNRKRTGNLLIKANHTRDPSWCGFISRPTQTRERGGNLRSLRALS